jgi:oligoribonuclease
MPLDPNDGPLVWIDCEMTGLDPRKDKIIEIAVCVFLQTSDNIVLFDGHDKVLITNGNLEIVDSGIEYVIRTDKKLLDGLVFNSYFTADD